ncbi:hypothetical protein [Sandarakinorhabdus limnophila]
MAPGKPTQNAFMVSFNSRMCNELPFASVSRQFYPRRVEARLKHGQATL